MPVIALTTLNCSCWVICLFPFLVSQPLEAETVVDSPECLSTWHATDLNEDMGNWIAIVTFNILT